MSAKSKPELASGRAVRGPFGNGYGASSWLLSFGATPRDDASSRVETLRDHLWEKFEQGEGVEAVSAIARVRRTIAAEFPEPRPPSAQDFMQQLRTFEERLNTFGDALAAATSRRSARA